MGQQSTVTLPWNQGAITALANAIAQGARSVSYDGRTVTYASLADMTATLDRMTRYVNGQGDGQPPPNVRGSVYVAR